MDDCMIRVENRRRADSRYYGLPGGCVRGDKCFYAHGQEDLQKRVSECSQGLVHSTASSSRLVNHSPEDLTKKVFVGGLSSSVESDDLREFFEEKFGPVIDAVVIESHLGDQVHSRGFGFVTFENEKSVVSAVQAHFVNIFGKKVEIKGAVPRLGSSHLETAKVSSGMPGAFHAMSDVISQRLLGLKLYSVTPNEQANFDTQGQYRYEGDTGMSFSREAACANSTRPTAPDCSPPGVAECRSWVPIFEQWLPKFLLEVCNRLKEGEWYPLSSLKGDFRATCGLELDHEAIGFHKLNDFIRSLPHLCRIKIVPVGLGPATHMVLLPAGSRMTTTGSHQIQELHPSCPTAAASLVETGRSYAAAICQGTISSGNGSLTSAGINSEMRTMEPHEDYSISRSSSSRSRSSGESLLRENDHDFTLAENNVNNLLREHAVRAPVFTNQFESGATLTCSPHEIENSNYLRQPSTPVEKNAGKENWDPIAKRAFGLNGQTANFIHQNCLECMNSYGSLSRKAEFHNPSETHDPSDHFIHQVLDCSSSTKPLETGSCGEFEEGSRIPLEQLTLTPFAYLKHEQQTAPPWVQNGPSNREASVQQSSSAGSNLYEESGQSNLNPHVAEKARGPLQKLFLLHPSDEDREKITAACAFGCKRKAIWMTFPCKHFALCSSCRDSFYRYWGKSGDSLCPVCFRVVEKWYALYY